MITLYNFKYGTSVSTNGKSVQTEIQEFFIYFFNMPKQDTGFKDLCFRSLWIGLSVGKGWAFLFCF